MRYTQIFQLKSKKEKLNDIYTTLCLHMLYVSIYLSIYMYIGSMFEGFFVKPFAGEILFSETRISYNAHMLEIFPEMIFQIKEHNKVYT